MPTVQSLLLQLVRKIDPHTKAGAEITSATIGTVNGDRFTAQRQLDIYNQARKTLLAFALRRLPKDDRYEALGGLEIKKTDLTFTGGSATKPDDYFETVLLTDSLNKLIPVLSTDNIPFLKDLESTTNKFVFEEATKFQSLTASTIPNGNYILRYYGISDFTLANVTGGTVEETFYDEWHPILLEIGEAIANGQGTVEINALTSAFLGVR